MVAAGEASGALAPILERLADGLERDQVVRGKVITALVYPAVLAVVALGVITALMMFVVPKVVDQFLAIVANKANQPVYVHCASANRVGAVWLVKRVLQDGWPVDKATTEAKAIGLSAPGLEKFALEYIAAHKK